MEMFDNTRAMTEGWAIFSCSGVEEDWRLERIDEVGEFESDINAWLHVAKKALDGDTYHISALKFLEVNEPGEFQVIENHAALLLGVNSLSHLFVRLKDTAPIERIAA